MSLPTGVGTGISEPAGCASEDADDVLHPLAGDTRDLTEESVRGHAGGRDIQVIDSIAGSVQPLARHTLQRSLESLLLLPDLDTPVSRPALPSDSSDEDIHRTLETWARAWSERDADAYLAHYSAEFTTGETGFSAAQWRQQRRTRVLKPDWIKVRVQDVRVESAGSGRARVRFQQEYRSPAVTETSRKLVELKREGEAWRIVAERTE